MIGIIGGTGIYDPESVAEIEKRVVETPYGGAPEIKIGDFEGTRIAFLARHGESHNVPPHRVNYRANIYALKELGIDRIISTNSVGGIGDSLSPGDVVVPHDFLDFTKGRESTFYDDRVVHVDVSNPYCSEIRAALVRAAGSMPKVFSNGVYACTQGPRFETPSEVRMIKKLGGDIVGMTGVPEVVLAKELEICYASLCIVANYAAGLKEEKLTATEVTAIVKKNENALGTIIKDAIKEIPAGRGCACGQALAGAEV